MTSESGTQVRRQIAVDLYGIELLADFQQRPGECAAPRTDLDQGLSRLRIYRLDDVSDDLRVMQEVLAEALAGKNHPPDQCD
jgi:hypothetical protein